VAYMTNDERVMNLVEVLSILKLVRSSFDEAKKETCDNCGMTRYTDKAEWIRGRDVDTLISRTNKLIRELSYDMEDR